MANLQGIYYDGKTSKAHSVDIILNANTIQFDAKYADPQKHIWSIGEMEDIGFTASDTLQIKYGDFPHQTLILKGENARRFHQFYPELKKDPIFHRVLKGNLFKVVFASLFLLIGTVLFNIYVLVPYVSEKAVVLVPKQAEITMGERMWPLYEANLNINEQKSQQLNAFFEEVGFESQYPVELYVSDLEHVNAFAMPGGKIVVFQGILDLMDSWEELAGLLGHELAHVEKRHSFKSICASLSSYLLVSVMTSDVGGITAVILESGINVQNLVHSRSHEKEADEVSLAYLQELNVDPNGLVELFEAMQAYSENDIVSADVAQALEFLSSHPATANRIAYLTNAIEKTNKTNYPENEDAAILFEQLKQGKSIDAFIP